MYSTCLFCNAPLGANTVLEEFPTGRRLAFDPARGRLWVVCRKCERWNLSPMEERWEAIEAAERLFRDTRMRVSTENIGLARHAGGLELVRIGSPMRPEFAAWRYGDQFGRRRRRSFIIGGGALAVFGTIAIAGAATGILSGAILAQSGNFVNLWVNGRTLVRIRTADGEIVKLKRPAVDGAKLWLGADNEWHLSVGAKKNERVFTGTEAQRITGLIMPGLNATGGRPAQVQDAVREIERVGGPQEYLADLGSLATKTRGRASAANEGPKLGRLTVPARLALEMALHEEQERRALDGELKGLELAWRSAEEVAAIADDLLLPDAVRTRMKNPD
jgi:hypothetical protein